MQARGQALEGPHCALACCCPTAPLWRQQQRRRQRRWRWCWQERRGPLPGGVAYGWHWGGERGPGAAASDKARRARCAEREAGGLAALLLDATVSNAGEGRSGRGGKGPSSCGPAIWSQRSAVADQPVPAAQAPLALPCTTSARTLKAHITLRCSAPRPCTGPALANPTACVQKGSAWCMPTRRTNKLRPILLSEAGMQKR